MRQVELYINNQTIDYNELKSIPASLRKRTDKFLEIVGADGSEIDNVLKSLAIPGSPSNQAKLQSLMNQSSLGRGDTRVSVKLVVNGIMLFAGPGILKKATKRSGSAPSHLVELLGDGLSLWEKLENVTLNSLSLGFMEWTFAETLSNWNDITFTTYKAWWCPVVYGNLRGDGYFSIQEFRPSVGFYPIMQAIFNGQGYTVVSEFFETNFFRRHAHLFGVGSKWKIEQPVEDMRFKGSYDDFTTIAVAFGDSAYVVPFDADDDPQSMYFDNGQPKLNPVQPGPPNNFVNPDYDQWLVIPFSGLWKIKITLNTQDKSILRVFASDGVVSVYDKEFDIAVSEEGAPGVTVEITTELSAGDEVRIWMIGTVISGIGTISRARFVKVRCQLQDEPVLGSDINIASCLPERQVKDFIRGVSHMFCLAWQVDEITKRVFVEPRFDYTLIEDGAPVTRKGFYRRDFPMVDIGIDAEEVSTEYVSPFGESLILSFKEDSNDPMEKATLAELQRDADRKQAPYYTDIPFFDRGAKRQNSPNPYFTTLYQSKPSDIQLREDSFLPTVLPSSYKRGNKLPGITWTPVGGSQKTEEPPTFESTPKCGIMFPDALLFQFHYDDSDTLYYSEGARAPWITQQKWQDMGGAPAQSDWDNHCAYADLLAKDTERNIRGLVSTFYPTYLACIKEGQVLSGRINIALPTIAALNYRRMCKLPFDGNESVWILLELTGYKALIADECEGKFIKYVTARKEDMDTVTYDDPDIEPIVPDIAPEGDADFE